MSKFFGLNLKVVHVLTQYSIVKALSRVMRLGFCYFEDALVDSLEEFDWRTPQRSLCSAYRSLMESYYYMLQKAKLTKDQRKQVFFNLRRQYMKMVIHDLHAVQDLSESDVRLVTLATQQISYHAVKLGDKDLLSLEQLNEVRNTVDVIQKRVNNAQPRSASDFARDVQYEVTKKHKVVISIFFQILEIRYVSYI